MSEVSSETTETVEQTTEYQRSISDGFAEIGNKKSSSKNIRLYCFACHRMEYHYNALKGKAYHYLLVGATFGLAWLFGPFRCRCCGHRRMARFNFLNPRFHYHRWKYSKGSGKVSESDSKSGSRRKSERRTSSGSNGENADFILRHDPTEEKSRSRRKRRKQKKLKSAPVIDTIGKERRQRQRIEEYAQSQQNGGAMNFSIDGIVESFETEESRKQRLQRLAEERAARGPFEAKKAKPRKKLKGKPKRRHAKKERLTGPDVYCFSCKQRNEHYHVLKGTSYYSFLFGITFGISAILGPFRCSVCGKKRLSGIDLLNPKFYLRHLLSNSSNGYGG